VSDRKLRVGVAGATGAVGRQLLDQLAEAGLPVGQVVPMASTACTVAQLEVGGRSVRVENCIPEQIRTLDLLFCAVPAKAAGPAIQAAREAGVPVIDLSGTLGPRQGVPSVVPAVSRRALQDFRELPAVASPRPDVVALASLLAPIREDAAELWCRGVVLHSAAAFGRQGVEELSDQVVSLFNSRAPARKVFAQGLAFDVLPALGEPDLAGWTADERRCAAASAALLDVAPSALAVTSAVGPWFNGLCLALHVEVEPALSAEACREMLSGAPGLAVVAARALPHPRGVDGSDRLHVGRIREDPAGRGVHLWAAADELRLGAANAVSILAALVEDDLL